MEVNLLRFTDDPLKIIADSARITRGKEDSDKSDEYFFKLLYKSGHLSVFEHVSFTFYIKDISRACSHQLVRFRVGVSFTQRSQRYTDESDFSYVVPPSMRQNSEAFEIYQSGVSKCREVYESLISSGIPKEDARFILPNGINTEIIMTMNYREIMHASSLRLCRKAQWEIRRLFFCIKREVKNISPVMGEYLQPNCFHDGFCKEVKPCNLLNYYLKLRENDFIRRC
ncbi:MAG: FAD-dependent thymidylate synthase [Caldisericia bacterium]|nr:FAD-dependent thymidylate synthase [Caldisericia bacterium]HOW02742.1 FAD-dependent thymidylate synthase [Caldisericia bacterium]HXK69904.1 FAD-dependent thymidylate synthase [Caldisericia bacterium]